MYQYRIIALHSNWVKSDPICGSQDSNCGHTNRSVPVKRYIWQVSLFFKIAINCSDLIILSNFDQFVTPYVTVTHLTKFSFRHLAGGLWQGPNFVRWCKFWQELPYSGHMWQITLLSRKSHFPKFHPPPPAPSALGNSFWHHSFSSLHIHLYTLLRFCASITTLTFRYSTVFL